MVVYAHIEVLCFPIINSGFFKDCRSQVTRLVYASLKNFDKLKIKVLKLRSLWSKWGDFKLTWAEDIKQVALHVFNCYILKKYEDSNSIPLRLDSAD